MPKVSGSSSATPDGGPMPGSAPISMPTITPASAIIRLNGVRAMPKPIATRSRLNAAAGACSWASAPCALRRASSEIDPGPAM